MSKRISISQAMMVVLAGCGVTTSAAEYGTTDESVRGTVASGLTGDTGFPRCPDPKTDCTHSNGSGVFFEEGGAAGINAPDSPVMMMITEFRNLDSSVAFRGRYADFWTHAEPWRWTDGTVDSADYKDLTGLNVLKVGEKDTTATWTLAAPGSRTQIPVEGPALKDLKLHITFAIESPALTPVHVLLEFEPADDIADTDPHGRIFTHHPVLHPYKLRWRSDVAASPDPTPYCQSAPGADGTVVDDPVVFQHGISVDPVNGTVIGDASTANVVAMSCARGAVAKVYNWGYLYTDPHDGKPFDIYLYASAIHMKRAAYCGNWDHYTTADVIIGFMDSSSINQYVDPPLIEARWSPKGATCVDLENLRDPDPKFSGTCPFQPTLPRCVRPRDTPLLEDYMVRTDAGT